MCNLCLAKYLSLEYNVPFVFGLAKYLSLEHNVPFVFGMWLKNFLQ